MGTGICESAITNYYTWLFFSLQSSLLCFINKQRSWKFNCKFLVFRCLIFLAVFFQYSAFFRSGHSPDKSPLTYKLYQSLQRSFLVPFYELNGRNLLVCQREQVLCICVLFRECIESFQCVIIFFKFKVAASYI